MRQVAVIHQRTAAMLYSAFLSFELHLPTFKTSIAVRVFRIYTQRPQHCSRLGRSFDTVAHRNQPHPQS
jgi:hypothetical protein